MKQTSTLPDIISSILLFIFLYAGIRKLADPSRFQDVLQQSSSLKPHSAVLVWLIPVLEITVAVFLFIYTTRLTGLYAATILLLLYTLYMGWMLLFSKHLPCNCGGLLEQLSWKGHLFLNAGLFLLTATAIVLFHRNVYRGKRGPP
jgi:uncharacterized membrane protein YphA (DoxX/SURF4 family)